MELFDYYLRYMTEVFEGTRPTPEGIVVTAEDEAGRMQQLSAQLAEMGIAAFVRACAAQDGVTLPEELCQQSDAADPAALRSAAETPQEVSAQAPEKPVEPDPDAGKHAFEVFLDCIALDDGLVQYLIEVLKKKDWQEFYKLSRITTKLDLDPNEFLYWLGNKEQYAPEAEQVCAAVMDACCLRLAEEKRLDVLAALLSGDQNTFELFRCEAPELMHLPDATFQWYCENYLDRDYPLRTILRLNGVEFPETLR